MGKKLEQILESGKTLSDIARYYFNNTTYRSLEKSKKILADNGIDWREWKNSKNQHKKVFCKFCGKEIISGDYRKMFCNSSCAASFNNKKRAKKKSKNKCLNCGKEISCEKKYCNNLCQQNYFKNEYVKRWKEGKETGIRGKYDISEYIRSYMLEKNNYTCERCGFSGKNPFTNKTIIQIHHIDGDCTNNKEENLQTLCPNCHAMTNNYGNRNKKSARKNRRKGFI